MFWKNKSIIHDMNTLKKKIHTYIITIREALRKEKGNQKQPLAWSTSSSWEDVLEFKETYSIIFEI